MKRRLGGWRYQQLHVQMQFAIAEHTLDRPEAHIAWITTLLKDYYDPMYQYQLGRKDDRVIFKGSYTQVQAFLLQQKNKIIATIKLTCNLNHNK